MNASLILVKSTELFYFQYLFNYQGVSKDAPFANDNNTNNTPNPVSQYISVFDSGNI